MVPHLKTALTGPLLSLEKHLIHEMANIEHWFHSVADHLGSLGQYRDRGENALNFFDRWPL